MFRRILGNLLAAVTLTVLTFGAAVADDGDDDDDDGAGGFAAPLFGLSSDDDDVLVADAGAGIVELDDDEAELEVALPGVTDISPARNGSLWATRGGAPDPRADSGQALLRVTDGGRVKVVANLFAFEAANDPDAAGIPDSNPFDVQSLGRSSALVVDAGGNDLLEVDRRGNITVLAVFPNELAPTADLKGLLGCPPAPAPGLCALPPFLPAQAVPTSVAIGPDGYYYVGELKGFPAPFNESNVWRVAPWASSARCGSSPDCVKVFDGGFTSIIDLAFAPDGTLYVAELDELSWFAVEVLGGGAGGTINACDVFTNSCSEVATGINQLTAITFDEDGNLLATEHALTPGQAGVIEVR